MKQTLISAIEIPLKLKGMPRKLRKINDTRENKPKRDLTAFDFDSCGDITITGSDLTA